jgi:hypothetical protein
MDKTIFTGKIEAKEMMERHPLEWEDLSQHPEKKEKKRVRKEFLILLLFVLVSGLLPTLSFARGLTDEEIMEAEKKLCWKCHRQPNLNSTEGVITSTLLYGRHGRRTWRRGDGKPVSFIDEKEMKDGPSKDRQILVMTK